MNEYQLYIDGRWQPAASGDTFQSINPATGEPWAHIASAGLADLEQAVAAAKRAHRSGVWRDLKPRERAAVLRRAADLCSERQEEIVMAEIQDSGATIRKGHTADVPAAVMTFQYYADLIEHYEDEDSNEEFAPVHSRNIVRREPVGVVGAIVPFNFPFAAASWKVAPALAAGCTMVLKPSPETPVTALLMGEILSQAGAPDGVLNVLASAGDEVGRAMVTHRDIDKIAFTGSTRVGQHVMQAAAAQVKDVLLELGGKSADIILEDANLDGAVPGALFGTFFHGGQVCTSGTRILVQESIHDAFVAQLVQMAKRIKVGDPMDFATTMGPLVSRRQLENTERYVATALKEGATCVFGGRRPEGLEAGFYHEPTIFTGVRNDMTVACEEVFGPVVVVMPFKDDEEALRIANDSLYGLAGAVWSCNVDRALRLARRIDAGTIWINDYHLLTPKYPFGGYKMSGIGRELGPEGLAAYQQVKHIHVGDPAGLEEKFYMNMLID